LESVTDFVEIGLTEIPWNEIF